MPAFGDRVVQRLGDAADRNLALKAMRHISYDWQHNLPDWQIRFLPAREGYRGTTFPEQKVIEIYVRSDDTELGLAHIVAHELGHAIDTTLLNDTLRQAWRNVRGYGAEVPWFVGSGASDYQSGAGDFAESFAWYQVRSGWYSQLGPPPNVVQMALLATVVNAMS